jgi:hypothetical protein
MRCCAGDEGLALRRRPAGGGVKPPQAALADDRRGERWGKGAGHASGGDREGERERTADDVSKQADGIETGAVKWARDEPGGCPSTGQVVSGMEAARVRSAASAWNVGRRMLTLLPGAGGCPGGERERAERREP